MNSIQFVFRLTVMIMFCAMFTIATQGQSFRTWVSTTGNDSNPCSRSAPCRNFAAAVKVTRTGGEVTALDSGEYDGPIFITQPITLMAAPGIHASLSVAPPSPTNLKVPDTININVPWKNTYPRASRVSVVLRNLYLSSQVDWQYFPMSTGINVISVDIVKIEDCVITGYGLGVHSVSQDLELRGTIVRNSLTGILIESPAGAPNPANPRWDEASALVHDSRLENNNTGIKLVGKFQATISESTVYRNGYAVVGDSDVNWSGIVINHSLLRDNITALIASSNKDLSASLYGDLVFFVANSEISQHNDAMAKIKCVGSCRFLSNGQNVLEQNGTGNKFDGTFSMH